MESTTTMVGNQLVDQFKYKPNGADHELQEAITNLMHQLVLSEGKFTLAELGYLHINTLTADRVTGETHLRIYFDARLASRVIKSATNTSKRIVPVAELQVFRNYLYVGDLTKAVTFEKIVAPKVKVVKDEVNRASLMIKDGKRGDDELAVLVLNCNLAITMAAIHDISLTDPCYAVKCTTAGNGQTAEKSIITATNREVPLAVIVTRSNSQVYDGYDCADAVPYLMSVQKKVAEASKNRDKLQEKVRKDAKKKKNKRDQAGNSMFNKYC